MRSFSSAELAATALLARRDRLRLVMRKKQQQSFASISKYSVLLVWDAQEKLWVSHVPSLGGISTFGATKESALKQTREAIEGYLEAAVKEGLEIPKGDAKAELVALEVATP
jgi:predicted RNase H-like HicB family nuclease